MMTIPPAAIDAPGVARRVAIAAWLCFGALVAAAYGLTGAPRAYLSTSERVAAAISAALLGGALISALARLYVGAGVGGRQVRLDFAAMSVALSVQGIALLSNALLACTAAPAVTDPLSGRPLQLVRLAEWTPLAAAMSFLFVAIDSHSVGLALRFALRIGAVVTLGSVLPLCGARAWSWAALLPIAAGCSSQVVGLAAQRWRHVSSRPSSGTPHDRLCWLRARLALQLTLAYGCFCALLLTIWMAELLVALTTGRAAAAAAAAAATAAPGAAECADERGPPAAPDLEFPFFFAANCALDALCALLCPALIVEASERVAATYTHDVLVAMNEQNSELWTNSEDVLVLSSRVDGPGSAESLDADASFTVDTVATPTICRVLGHEAAAPWLSNHSHVVRVCDDLGAACAPPDGPELGSGAPATAPQRTPPIVVVADPSQPATSYLHHIVCAAWTAARGLRGRRVELRWYLPRLAEADEARRGLKCERVEVLTSRELVQMQVIVSSVGDGRGVVLKIRDLGEHLARLDAEHALGLQAAERLREMESLARRKDEEANHFLRHEVKNRVLAAVECAERLRGVHQRSAALHKSAQPPDVRLLHADSEQRRWAAQLQSALKAALETVLANAVTVEVLNGTYIARPEVIDPYALLTVAVPAPPTNEQSGTGTHTPTSRAHSQDSTEVSWARSALAFRRCTLLAPVPIPPVEVDAQLLALAYRSLVANAHKHGPEDGDVIAEVTLDGGWLVLDVSNEPGPSHIQLIARLLSASTKASGAPAVGEEGGLLDAGTSIVRHCAAALGAAVSVFATDELVTVRLQVPVKVHGATAELDTFQLPPDVLALGIDDSAVQRAILKRIFRAAGACEARTTVTGSKDEDALGFAASVVRALRDHPDQRVLVIADENLELARPVDGVSVISGSEQVARARAQLDAAEAARLLAIIRSANDSARDVAVYLERAHGVMSKTPFNREQVRRDIAPLWIYHFPEREGKGLGAEALADELDAQEAMLRAPPVRPAPSRASTSSSASGAALSLDLALGAAVPGAPRSRRAAVDDMCLATYRPSKPSAASARERRASDTNSLPTLGEGRLSHAQLPPPPPPPSPQQARTVRSSLRISPRPSNAPRAALPSLPEDAASTAVLDSALLAEATALLARVDALTEENSSVEHRWIVLSGVLGHLSSLSVGTLAAVADVRVTIESLHPSACLVPGAASAEATASNQGAWAEWPRIRQRIGHELSKLDRALTRAMRARKRAAGGSSMRGSSKLSSNCSRSIGTSDDMDLDSRSPMSNWTPTAATPRLDEFAGSQQDGTSDLSPRASTACSLAQSLNGSFTNEHPCELPE